jgi:beta-glucosidase
VKELKAYRKLSLKRGETKSLTFTLTVEDLKFYNQHLQYIYEPGEFNVFVGPNSRDVQAVKFLLSDL